MNVSAFVPPPFAEGRVSIIVPIRNSMRYLPAVLGSIRGARERYPGSELILVDHGSDDGSWEFINEAMNDDATLLRTHGGTISHVRNLGAAHARGEFLSFLDSDCLIPPDYLHEAVSALARTGAAATGSRVDNPDHPHWIEDAWTASHERRSDGFTHFMNSGNFFVRAEAFRAVGGFDESLATGEDAEISQRLNASGWRIYEAKRVRAIHLGNAKTVGDFFRKEVWRGLGQFATATRTIDKPLAMTFIHLGLATAAVAALALGMASGPVAVGALLASQLAVPVVTVLYRVASNRTLHRPLTVAFLYWLFYWARIAAMGKVLLRRPTRPGPTDLGAGPGEPFGRPGAR